MATSNAYAERALELMPGPHSNLPGYELFKPIWITRRTEADAYGL